MRLEALFKYPIKSCYRVPVRTAAVEPWGLAGDRRWLIVDPVSNLQLTQRKLPELGRIRPALVDDGLMLNGELHVPYPVVGAADLVEVRVWNDRVLASPAGPDVDAWVSKVVGQDCHLVYLDDPTRRPVDPDFAAADDRVTFSDGYPLLLTNAASLTAVNDWLLETGEEPITMTRFRPNLVVSGAPAWAEDAWLGHRLQVGPITFRAVKPCSRCVLTTIDPETLVKGRQPLHILGRRRRFPEGLLFGTNLIPDNRGELTEGDEFTVLSSL